MKTNPLTLVVCSICWTLLVCVATSNAEDAVLSLELAPKADAKFSFGKLDEARFILENKSKHALVVRNITPRTIGNDAVGLSSTLYGEVHKHETRDEWIFNELSQQATRQAFHGGLLLPGERFTVLSPYRPVSRQEEFEVSYVQSEGPYDGTPDSLKPFRIYVPRSRDRIGGIREFVPFSEIRWKEMSSQFATIRPLGPDSSPRMVLIPDDSPAHLLTPDPEKKPRPEGKSRTVTFRLAVPLAETDFGLEDALPVAARLAGRPVAELQAAYSSTLSAYVIFERDCAWRLASKDQKARGELLAPFPPSLLNALDSGPYVRVRVGEKQEGLGPDVKDAGRLFWDHFPVKYGDGMYTRGEFLHLAKDDLLVFLKMAHERQKVLGRHNYFFRNEYFTLQDRLSAPARR